MAGWLALHLMSASLSPLDTLRNSLETVITVPLREPLKVLVSASEKKRRDAVSKVFSNLVVLKLSYSSLRSAIMGPSKSQWNVYSTFDSTYYMKYKKKLCCLLLLYINWYVSWFCLTSKTAKLMQNFEWNMSEVGQKLEKKVVSVCVLFPYWKSHKNQP